MQQQFEQLKRDKSILIEDGTPVIWPKCDRPGEITPSKFIGKFGRQKVYYANSRGISYVHQGKLYLTPYTKESLDIIRDSGFKLREGLHIPFCQGDQPVGEYKEKWESLVAAAKKTPGSTKKTGDVTELRSPKLVVATA